MCNMIFIIHSHSKTIQKNLIAVFGIKENLCICTFITMVMSFIDVYLSYGHSNRTADSFKIQK